MWQWNWKREDPELVSFGWSSVNANIFNGIAKTKVTTPRRKIFKAVKMNLRFRTKKDGVGTWAPEDHEPTKRNKFNLEYATRDFAQAVCKHARQRWANWNGRYKGRF